MKRTAALLFAAALLVSLLPTASFARSPLTDQQIVNAIIQECAAIYHASRPCACPDDRASNGSSCGRRSAYSRPGGASPRCYAKDVSVREIADYRAGKKDFAGDCAPLP
jgi:hypothetical protein